MAALPQHPLQQQQQQSKSFRNFDPIGGQIFNPIAFYSHANLPDQSQPSFFHAMGPTAADGGSNGWDPRGKRPKEEFLENSQISSVDFLRTGSVSTGLGLSLDSNRHLASSSGESPLNLLPMVDNVFDRELQRMDAEMDSFIRIQLLPLTLLKLENQATTRTWGHCRSVVICSVIVVYHMALKGDRLRKSILEKVQAKQHQTLASFDEKILWKIREKELEVQDITEKNMELEEQMRKLSNEVGMWQQQAKYNEDMITALRFKFQQVYAQSWDKKNDDDNNNREGCGDSKVDDSASCCNGAINFQLLCKENKKDSMACKVCGVNEVLMLLLPCRHLCLCKDCEVKLNFCPLCQSSKFLGIEVYM